MGSFALGALLALAASLGCGARSRLGDGPGVQDAGGPDADSDADSDTDSDTDRTCERDDECVPADCCCSGLPFCVPVAEAPDCRDVVCAMVVCPEPMPPAACGCVHGTCGAVPMGECSEDSGCTLATAADECCPCPDAYPVSRVDAEPCLVRENEPVPRSCTECDADCGPCADPSAAVCDRGRCVAR